MIMSESPTGKTTSLKVSKKEKQLKILEGKNRVEETKETKKYLVHFSLRSS